MAPASALGALWYFAYEPAVQRQLFDLDIVGTLALILGAHRTAASLHEKALGLLATLSALGM
jgi:hypothetical protein